MVSPDWYNELVAKHKAEGFQAGNLLAIDPEIFQHHMRYVEKTVKHDVATKTLVFLTAFSAYTPNPINLFLRGESSIGKSYNTTETIRHFPQSDIMYLGGLSPTALVHEYGVLVDENDNPIDLAEKPKSAKPKKRKSQTDEEYEHEVEMWKEEKLRWQQLMQNARYVVDLTHKTLVFLEPPPRETYHKLRPILSHDKTEISYKFTDRSSRGKLQTMHVVLRGWPATIFLTTEEEYLEELATRSFTATPETDASKLRAGVNLVGERKAFPWKFSDDFEFTLLQGHLGWLRKEVPNFSVANPMGREFAGNYPADKPRCMRDVNHIMSLLEVSALFHCQQRPILIADDRTVVLVSMADVELIQYFLPSIMETTETGLPEYMLQIFHNVMEPLYKDTGAFDYQMLTDKHNEVMGKKRSRDTLYPIVSALSKAGYVSTDPNPNDKRTHLIRIIKNEEEDTFDSLLKTFMTSYSLEDFRKWLNQGKKYLRKNSIVLKQKLVDDNNSTPQEIYEKHYLFKPSQTRRYFFGEKQPETQTEQQTELADTFNRQSKTITTILKQIKAGPHQLAINEYRQGVCYCCLQNEEIVAVFEDFKAQKHDLCGDCMWKISQELEGF